MSETVSPTAADAIAAPEAQTPADTTVETTAEETIALDCIPYREHPQPPQNLPYDDGVPLETARHRTAMNLLIAIANNHLSQVRSDFFCGGNMFVYYSETQVRNKDFRGPDFFTVLDVEGEDVRDRKYWAIWDENGRYPDVIVELMSPSTARIDTVLKKDLYERTFKTRDYFVFDPYEPDSLQGWALDSNLAYEALSPNERGWLWCRTLELWLGTWEGTIQKQSALWLRFFDRDGNLVLLPEEAAAAELSQTEAELTRTEAELEKERQRSQAMAEQLRSLGIDPDNL
ncbi:MAG: Uma2 family endonuclease [Cyanobacteriota bacterium]|nr:Uma2 family endonuclease [Cyanobacteriota bacterium]